MLYVSSPYTHKDPRVEEHRFLMAEFYVSTAMLAGFPVFSPIVYCHNLALKYQLPGDAAYWKKFNNTMLRKADAVHVLNIIGWRESKGVQYEMMMAEELGIPVLPVEMQERFPEGLTL